MIIAAYAGVGKTYFCNQNPNAIDLVCMPFKYTNLFDMPDSQADNGEQVKASLDLELRKNWILYYYWMIKYLLSYCPEREIVIPTIGPILDFLDTDQIPYTVVYPDKCLKEEYIRCYKDRGNSESFRGIFIGQWDERLKSLEERKNSFVKHIVLQKNQYLSDVIACRYEHDSYVDQQIRKFEQSLHGKNQLLSDNLLPEDPYNEDEMNAVFYLKPICEDDIVSDYCWINSKKQLKELLKKYEHTDSRTCPVVCVLELKNTSKGICSKEQMFKGYELKEWKQSQILT